MDGAREVGRRESYSLLGLPLQAVELQDGDWLEASPGSLSPSHSGNALARESVSCMVPPASVQKGGSGAVTQVWDSSILFQGSVKSLSQADPVPGSIPRRLKRAEMTHCSPFPSQGSPLAVPGHCPGPLLLFMAMTLAWLLETGDFLLEAG